MTGWLDADEARELGRETVLEMVCKQLPYRVPLDQKTSDIRARIIKVCLEGGSCFDSFRRGYKHWFISCSFYGCC